LIIPASQAYGARGLGPIPGGSALVFDVELVGVI
jgi:FKBP-type peptidyl-prolyl cis-trans isomerase